MYSVLLLATPLTIYSAVASEWQCHRALVNKMAAAAVCILEVSEKTVLIVNVLND